MTESLLTSFGLVGIDVVPYGVHLCHFYASRQELFDGLRPYFLAGINNNERCIWAAASPLPANEIRIEVQADPVFDEALKSGQLTILDALEWYGTIKPEDIIRGWIKEEESALANGYNGLRVAGNTTFLQREQWDSFMDYEQQFHEQLRERRIVACCSYHRETCKPVEMLEVVNRHHGAMDRCGSDGWQLLRAEHSRWYG